MPVDCWVISGNTQEMYESTEWVSCVVMSEIIADVVCNQRKQLFHQAYYRGGVHMLTIQQMKEIDPAYDADYDMNESVIWTYKKVQLFT